jgi:hypothetical protein
MVVPLFLVIEVVPHSSEALFSCLDAGAALIEVQTHDLDLVSWSSSLSFRTSMRPLRAK